MNSKNLQTKNKRPHHKLEVWQKSMKLVKDIYTMTEQYPKSEVYGLTSQMRRSAISVPSNIAEGAARRSKAEFLQFLSVAQGSLSELDTQLELSKMLGFIEENEYSTLFLELNNIFKLLSGLMRSVK